MAHEGFNWKQQSLLACILFSSRVQRTPIISFLLYCLFSSPPAALPASSPSLQNRQQNYPFPLSAPLASTVLPRPTLSSCRVSFEFPSVSSPVRSPNDLGSRVRVVCRDTHPSFLLFLLLFLPPARRSELTGYSTEFLRSSTTEKGRTFV